MWGVCPGDGPRPQSIYMTTRAYIALGSNQGDRQAYLASALDALRSLPGVTHVETSPTYETDPVGGPAGQGRFLNAVAAVTTDLSAEQLLQALHQIEANHGRDRSAEPQRSAPRTLDLDILLFGDVVIGYSGGPEHPGGSALPGGLTVPHPRMHQREFVLRPLCDIAPDLVHPVLKRTISELLAGLS